MLLIQEKDISRSIGYNTVDIKESLETKKNKSNINRA